MSNDTPEAKDEKPSIIPLYDPATGEFVVIKTTARKLDELSAELEGAAK